MHIEAVDQEGWEDGDDWEGNGDDLDYITHHTLHNNALLSCPDCFSEFQET
jgi:hypothetical protein